MMNDSAETVKHDGVVLSVCKDLQALLPALSAACRDVGHVRRLLDAQASRNARNQARRRRLQAAEDDRLHRQALRQADAYKRVLKQAGAAGARRLIEERPESLAEKALVRKAVTAGMTPDELWLTEVFADLTNDARLFEVLKIWALKKNSKFPHRLISEREMIRRFRGINSDLIATMKHAAEKANGPAYRRLLAMHTACAPRENTLRSAMLSEGKF